MPRRLWVLAHGAGAAMDSPFMNRIAAGVGELGIRVARFEFPYMDSRRRTGKRAAPGRDPLLRATSLEVIERLGGGARLVIGHKSMGGRIASLIADEAGVKGLVCLGYPSIHPDNPSGCGSSICAFCVHSAHALADRPGHARLIGEPRGGW